MARRILWKPKPASRIPSLDRCLRDLASRLHRHGCERCAKTYEDSCGTPQANGFCTECRTGRTPPLWETNLNPIDCCYDSSQKANVSERVTYRLAGPTDWFLCRKCYRPHIYEPRRELA